MTVATKSERTISFARDLEQSVLMYAMDTILDRALPDVRDGLKPVHRRILRHVSRPRLTLTSRTRARASSAVLANTIRTATSRSTMRWCV